MNQHAAQKRSARAQALKRAYDEAVASQRSRFAPFFSAVVQDDSGKGSSTSAPSKT